jgi:hypothetical protein
MFSNIFKIAGPLAAVFALSACDANFSIDGGDGVSLSELDLSGAAPTEVVLAGPDNVNISEGEFDIKVDGDREAIERMRFTLEDGALGVMREDGNWIGGDAAATVSITMPAPERLTLAGSGNMTSERLGGNAEVTIAGSGDLETPAVDAESLEVTIAGSGTYTAAGRTSALELSILGAGDAEMAGLTAGNAEINIAGSGEASFASNGEVEANIMGSGDVTVRGSARCTVNSMGSGNLTCERAAATAAAD